MENITVNDILEATGGRLLCGSPNQALGHISIDSRHMEGQDLFVPLIGEKTDAHQFIRQALENGAAAVLTSEHDAMEDDKPWIWVEDTKKALQAIGAAYRKRLSLPLVGITGSVGKTTTREMIACALSAGYQVYKTPANHNSQVGVPLTLTELSSRDQIGVIELGMSEPGELTVIAKIAEIQMAVITNIGVAHIEQLGSQKNIFHEKMTIQDGLTEGGVLFLNGDDPFLKDAKARDGFSTIYYGFGDNCDYRAVDLHTEEGFPVFTAVHGEEKALVRLRVMGQHNVVNAMAALAVASKAGVPLRAAACKLEEFTGFQGRQQIYKKRDITIIDDSYNASPVSMKAGLEVLRSVESGGRKIAVLGDMKELGENALRFHYEIGEYIADHPLDYVVLLGELSKAIGKAVEEKKAEIPVKQCSSMEELTSFLEQLVKPGDTVLFKASNSMNLKQAVSHFI